MNSRQRMAAAMRGEAPDRVPVMCQLALGHYFLHTDIPPREIWFTSDGFAAALVQLQQRYRFDGILINLPGRPDGLLDGASFETARDGEQIRWPDGSNTLVPADDNPIHTPAPHQRARFDFDRDPIEALKHVDDFIGYVWGVYHVPTLPGKRNRGLLREVPDYFLNTIDRVRARLAELGDEVSIHGEVFSPFTHFMELIGYELALMSLLMDGDKAHALLDRLTEASVAWAVAQAHHGVDAVLISSAFAGAPMLSPAMYREFVLPYERRVTDAVRATGVPVYTHTCGSIGDRLEAMVETGTQGIDTLDPPPLGNVVLSDAKQRLDGRVFIKGNMNSVELLDFDAREQVIAHARERIEVGKPGGGYILSTACSVAPRVAPWKLELLTPLAEELGRYEGN